MLYNWFSTTMCFHWFQPFKSRLVCWIYVWWPFGSTRGTREGWEKAYLFKIELHFHFPTLNRFENWWWFCLNQIDFVSPSPGLFFACDRNWWVIPPPPPARFFVSLWSLLLYFLVHSPLEVGRNAQAFEWSFVASWVGSNHTS